MLLAPNADPYKEVGKLNAQAKQASELKHTIALAEPPKHDGGVGNLVLTIEYSDAQECGVCFSSETMHCVLETRIHAVRSDGMRSEFGRDVRQQWQFRTDRAKTSYRVQRELEARIALILVVWRRGGARELWVVFVRRIAAHGSLFTALGQIVHAKNVNRCTVNLLTQQRPVSIFDVVITMGLIVMVGAKPSAGRIDFFPRVAGVP